MGGVALRPGLRGRGAVGLEQLRERGDFGGGTALFYAANAAVSLRCGQSPGTVLPWTLPAVVIALGLVPAGANVPAAVVLGMAVALLALVTAYVEAKARRRRRSP